MNVDLVPSSRVWVTQPQANCVDLTAPCSVSRRYSRVRRWPGLAADLISFSVMDMLYCLSFVPHVRRVCVAYSHRAMGNLAVGVSPYRRPGTRRPFRDEA